MQEGEKMKSPYFKAAITACAKERALGQDTLMALPKTLLTFDGQVRTNWIVQKAYSKRQDRETPNCYSSGTYHRPAGTEISSLAVFLASSSSTTSGGRFSFIVGRSRGCSIRTNPANAERSTQGGEDISMEASTVPQNCHSSIRLVSRCGMLFWQQADEYSYEVGVPCVFCCF